MIHSLTFDTSKQHKTKPNNPAIVSRNLQTKVETTIKEFSELVTQPIGYSFCPATFNGSRKNDNWIQQSVFCLDFDTGLEPDVGLKYFVDLGIRPNVIYTSFSDTPELRKTRFCFFIDRSITCRNTFKFIQLNLMRVINDQVLASDKSCSDRARMFYPGKEVIHLDEQENDYEMMLALLNIIHLGGQSANTLRKRGVKSFIFVPDDLKSNFPPNDGSSSSSENVESDPRKGGNSSPSIYIYMQNHKNPPFEGGDLDDTLKLDPYLTQKFCKKELDPKNWYTKNFNFEEMRKKIRVLDDLLSGIRLPHLTIFGLATNLKYVPHGLKVMEEAMLKFNEPLPLTDETRYSDNNFLAITYVEKMSYLPQNLKAFTTHESDKEYTNILSACRVKHGLIERIEPEKPKISLKEAEEKLKVEFEKAINAKDKNIYIFKVPTGIGKSQLLTTTKYKAALAFPTHKLKTEVVERINAQYRQSQTSVNDVFVIPQVPTLSNPNIEKDIAEIFSLGKITSLTRYLKTLLNGGYRTKHNRLYQLTKQDKARIQAYLSDVEVSYTTHQNVATTHHRLIRGGFDKHHTYIFDECPFPVMNKISKIYQNDLYNAYMNCDISKEAKNHIKGLMTIFDSLVWLRPKKLDKSSGSPEYITKEIIKGNLKAEFLEFDNAEYMVKTDQLNMSEAFFMTCLKFPPDKKIIILSATAPVELYKMIYGDRVKVIEMDDIETVGKQIQYTKFSYSRQSLNTHKNISKKVGSLPVITFANHKHLFQNPVKNIHFGNSAGYDELNGMDMAVVGTPHVPRVLVVLYALASDQYFVPDDLLLEYRQITYNGFRFAFNAYFNNLLKIQLALIEAEMIQAVGRNRILRQNCTTHLFSNLPLKSTTQFVYEPDDPLDDVGEDEEIDDDGPYIKRDRDNTEEIVFDE